MFNFSIIFFIDLIFLSKLNYNLFNKETALENIELELISNKNQNIEELKIETYENIPGEVKETYERNTFQGFEIKKPEELEELEEQAEIVEKPKRVNKNQSDCITSKIERNEEKNQAKQDTGQESKSKEPVNKHYDINHCQNTAKNINTIDKVLLEAKKQKEMESIKLLKTNELRLKQIEILKNQISEASEKEKQNFENSQIKKEKFRKFLLNQNS